jgi:hypothetical protein
LIASPFATGVAEATVASNDVPATNTIVATSFVKRLAILLSPRGVALRRTILWTGGGSLCDPKRWFERNHPGGAVIAVTAERPLAERQVQRGASLTQDRAKQSNMSKAIFR